MFHYYFTLMQVVSGLLMLALLVFHVRLKTPDFVNFFVIFTTIMQLVHETEENVNINIVFTASSPVAYLSLQYRHTILMTKGNFPWFMKWERFLLPTLHNDTQSWSDCVVPPSHQQFVSARQEETQAGTECSLSNLTLPCPLTSATGWLCNFWEFDNAGPLAKKEKGQNKKRDGDNLFLESNLTVGSRCIWTVECRGI